MTHWSGLFVVTWICLCLVTESSAFWPFGGGADDKVDGLRRSRREVNPTESQRDEVQKNEDTVINTILRVVDHKFDTLSARITALERAVNGLQYYSVRQFRLLFTNSKSTNSQIQDISTRVSGLEIEVSRADLTGIRDRVKNIENDVKMLFRQNNDMFEGMEQTLVVVNDNVNKGVLETKNLVESKFSDLVISRTLSNATEYDDTEDPESDPDTVIGNSRNGDTVTEERPPPDLIEASTNQADIVTFSVSKHFHKLENLIETYINQSTQRELEYHTTTIATTPVPTLPTESPANIVLEITKEATGNVSRMIRSVQNKMGDSVKFQRHAEHMLERLITNGESLTEQSIALSDNIARLEGKIRDLEEQSSKSTVRVEELQSHSLLEAKRLAEKYVKSGQLAEECQIPANLRIQIGAIISKNASHVFNQLTELTKLSTKLLPTTLLDLHEAINKVEKISNEYSNLLNQMKFEDNNERVLFEQDLQAQVYEVLNVTSANFNILEAVSSNTGWLPLLLDTIDVIGMTANKTLAKTFDVYEKVEEPIKIYIQSKTSLTTGSPKDAILKHGTSSGVTEVNLYNDKVDKMFTSVEKFEKFFPAISRIIGEKGNVMNLVNGSDVTEGRVEFFHDGLWGTLCSQDFTDGIANDMCTYLGFPGGHVAPRGTFGPGEGTIWKVNPTCFKNSARVRSTCVENVLESRKPCSHDDDLGLVCHQMVKLGGYSTGGRGMVLVYTNGAWGGVCYDGWDDREATVACKQINSKYHTGRAVIAAMVHPSKPAWLSNLSCSGKEERLDLCKHSGWRWHRCLSNRFAGVQCQ